MYMLQFAKLNGSFNPADGVTDYIGLSEDKDVNALVNVRAPRNGVVIAAGVCIRPHGGQPTAEAVTVSLRIEGTDILLETAKALNTGGGTLPTYFQDLSMSDDVEANETLVFKILWPTWVTNPTNVRMNGWVLIEDDAITMAVVAQDSGISDSLAAILTNDSDISALVAEQLTQDSSVSANLAAILTNDSDISELRTWTLNSMSR